MQNENSKNYNHIQVFNPDVVLLESVHQDFLLRFKSKIQTFNAGIRCKNFNEFLKEEAIDYQKNGDGVTYTVWDVLYNDNGEEVDREIVAYYTLSATAIPYEDRIRLDAEEAAQKGEVFDIQMCGIPSVEIKMFAVDEKYQDVFFEYDGEDMPIAAWILKNIIHQADELMTKVLGFKAIFLHAIPDAEQFYLKNGFHLMKINMRPLYSVDSEYTAMYLPLQEVHMSYDK